MKTVLANGADVNERTGGGQTPLILATVLGHTHLIPLLLDAGADPHLRDKLGLNAIDWAQRRGATEAIAVLKNKPVQVAQSRPEIHAQTPAPTTIEREVEKPSSVSAEERSRRWIAGLKQRIAEQSQQEIPDGPNIFRARPALPLEPQPQLASAEREPQPEMPVTTPEPQPEIPAPSPDPQTDLPAEPQIPEPESPVVPPARPESPGSPPQPDIQALKVEPEPPRRSSSRKRCPKCNATYNSELLAYCGHHIVPLVDDVDGPPIISEPQKTSPVLFWMIVIITLTGSVVVGSLVATFFYSSKQVSPPVVAAKPPPPGAVQKGTPAVDGSLEGKVVSLPIAECPLNGQEAIPGRVVVRVTVARNGHVTQARASGGDWLLRGAATEAAMKSTFSPEKLRGRAAEGTITYTFEP